MTTNYAQDDIICGGKYDPTGTAIFICGRLQIIVSCECASTRVDRFVEYTQWKVLVGKDV